MCLLSALLIPARIPENPTLAGACGGGEGVGEELKKAHRFRWALLNIKYQISILDATNTKTAVLIGVAAAHSGVTVVQ